MHVHDDREKSMGSLERMETIINYWVEHNMEHLKEHKKWLGEAEKLGMGEVVVELRKAVELFERATGHLEVAKRKLVKYKEHSKE
jgi:hypothetical protein